MASRAVVPSLNTVFFVKVFICCDVMETSHFAKEAWEIFSTLPQFPGLLYPAAKIFYMGSQKCTALRVLHVFHPNPMD